MSKKFFIGLIAVVVVLLTACQSAHASIFLYDTRAAWESAVGAGNFADLNLGALVTPGTTVPAGTFITPDGTNGITFNQDLAARQVGSGWATWSGGNTPVVLFAQGQSSVTGTFTTSDNGAKEFGFEMEPDTFGLFSMTLALSDGSTLTRMVDGNAGAAFFGWTGDESIKSITLSTTDSDFAFGRMVYGTGSTRAVPEPASMLLFGIGSGALAFLRRKQLV